MKRKIFYILMFFCCMSIFSSAKQTGKDCGKKTCCMLNKKDCLSRKKPETTSNVGLNLSPLQIFVLGI